MTASPESRAEVARIAGLVGVDETALEFLSRLSAESLYEFRQQLIAIYFEENPGLARFAKIANVLPAAVIAKLTQDAIGPTLAARVVGQVDTGQAVSVLKRVPVPFICDIAVQADPRRVIPLFSQSPTRIAEAVADELIARKEYVAIGQLIAYVEDDVMRHALDTASDLDILFSSFLVEDKDRLSDGVAMLSSERLESIVQTAADNAMWLEVLDLMSHLDADEFVRVVDQAAVLQPEVIDELLAFAHGEDLWYVVLPAICLTNDPEPLVAALLRAKPAVRKGFSAAAAAADGDYDEMLGELTQRCAEPGLLKLIPAPA